jgi:hypothetical protein
MSLWDDVKKNIGDLYSTTAEKTTEIARIQSRRYDKFGLSREIERQFSELGSIVYSGLQENREGILEEPGIGPIVERITALEQELRRKDEEIEAIRREHAARKTAGRTAAAAEGGTDVPKVLTEPVLAEGSEDSPILMEPGAEEELDEHDPNFGS